MSNIDKHAVQAVADLKAGYTLGHADVAILNELARIALASLEAEAVAWRNKDSGHCGTVLIQGKSPIDCGYEPLYLAPPAPVSVPDITALDNLAGEMLNHAMNCERRVSVAYTHCAHRLAEEVRDLRAAMLQGAEPVTTDCKLPGDFESFISWLTSGDGIPDWLINGDKLDDEKVSFLLKVYRAGGNSPVIPDWQAKAEKLAELHGSSFVVFRNGEYPQCADPTKVIISFTDEGLGHGSAAPQQE